MAGEKEKWGIRAGNTGFFKLEEVEVRPHVEHLLGPGDDVRLKRVQLSQVQGRNAVALAKSAKYNAKPTLPHPAWPVVCQ
jgi:hypothetical protein